jgi:hypothetical protein
LPLWTLMCADKDMFFESHVFISSRMWQLGEAEIAWPPFIIL